MRFPAAILGLAILLGSSRVEAATLLSGPLTGDAGHLVACHAVNASNRVLDQVVVEIFTFNGTGEGINTCSDVDPGFVCPRTLTLSLGNQHYCQVTVTGGGKKKLRSTFCNVTTGNCSEVR